MDENKLFEKLRKVVQSIETKEQVKSAYNYYKLWEKRYGQKWIQLNPGLAWVDGNTLGYLRGFLKAKM